METLDRDGAESEGNHIARLYHQARATSPNRNAMRGLLDYTEKARDFVKDRADWTKGLLGAAIELATDKGKLAAAMARQPKAFSPESAARSQAMAQDFWNPAGLLGKIVYHGSPHKFTKFDASKIGSGEGAQAYGHGIYLADSESVAKQYKADRGYVGKAMAGAPVANDWGAEWIAKNAVDIHGDEAADYLRSVLKQNRNLKAAGQAAENAKVEDAISLVTGGKVSPSGALYKADLPDEWIPKMLDWDKPLSQQPENVRIAIQDFGLPENATGKQIYDALANHARDLAIIRGKNSATTLQASQSGAAESLREFGIPGIRYLDGGSRSAGQGSYNYVVFPGLEDQIKILERNGQPLGLLGGR